MAQTPEQWFSELCTDAGYSAEQTAALLALAKNDKISSKVTSVLKTAQDDYSKVQNDYHAQLGRVKAAEDKVRAYDNWYGDASTKYKTAVEELEAARQALANGHSPINTDKFLTKDDAEALLRDRDNRYASVLKDIARISSRHAAQYHEELDTDAVEKIAAEKNLTVSQAYEQWIKPRADEASKKKYDDAIKSAREEGAREALSRHKPPVDPVPTETAPMYNRMSKDEMPKDQDADLLAAWHGVKSK